MPVYKILFLICLWMTLPFFYSSLRELIIFCIISFNHRFKYDGYPWWLHSLLQRRYQYKLNSTVDTHTNTHTHTHTHTRPIRKLKYAIYAWYDFFNLLFIVLQILLWPVLGRQMNVLHIKELKIEMKSRYGTIWWVQLLKTWSL